MIAEDRATEALLELIRFRDERAPASPIQLDEPGWKLFTSAAVRHGLAPLAYARLGESGARFGVPERVLRVLKVHFLRTGLENLRLYARLAAALHALAVEAIDAIVLKGAFLAEAVYGDRALRPMADADILVRRDHLRQVERLLHAQGWRQEPDDAAADLTGHQLPTFVLDAVQIEIHWSIEDDESPFAIDSDGLWKRACQRSVAGQPALALCPEDLLLHLCLHTTYAHGWLQFGGGLRSFYDIAAVIGHYADRFDWGAFVLRANAWRCRNCALLTLLLARDLMGAAVPERALDQLASHPVDPGLVKIATDLTLGVHYVEVARCLPALGKSWLTKRWWNLPRAARWRRHLFPKPRSLVASYPRLGASATTPLHYLAHWAALARDCARVALARNGRVLLARERRRRALAEWLESSAMNWKT